MEAPIDYNVHFYGGSYFGRKKQDIENKIEELENNGTILPTDWQDFNWAEKTFPLIRDNGSGSYSIDQTLDMLLSAKYEYGEFLNIASERSPDKICPNLDKCRTDIIEGYNVPSPAPDYLNKEHHAYSAMFALACSCWEGFLANDKDTYSMDDIKKKIFKWLDNNCGRVKLTDHKKGFIYEVIRPDYSRKRGPKDNKIVK